MIKFDVVDRWSGDVKFTAEIDCGEYVPRSVKLGLAVKWAVENYANLWNTDLRNANLSDANLNTSHGINDFVKSIQIEEYAISYTSDILQIGCQRHPITQWRDFDDRRIAEMDGKTALKFWRKYKDWIFQTTYLCPAKPTVGASK